MSGNNLILFSDFNAEAVLFKLGCPEDSWAADIIRYIFKVELEEAASASAGVDRKFIVDRLFYEIEPAYILFCDYADSFIFEKPELDAVLLGTLLGERVDDARFEGLGDFPRSDLEAASFYCHDSVQIQDGELAVDNTTREALFLAHVNRLIEFKGCIKNFEHCDDPDLRKELLFEIKIVSEFCDTSSKIGLELRSYAAELKELIESMAPENLNDNDDQGAVVLQFPDPQA